MFLVWEMGEITEKLNGLRRKLVNMEFTVEEIKSGIDMLKPK
ncbi:MAG: hypothetical protein ABSG92_10900 [Conexivisphaerales archaeon]